jgi:hypothetical protein
MTPADEAARIAVSTGNGLTPIAVSAGNSYPAHRGQRQ